MALAYLITDGIQGGGTGIHIKSIARKPAPNGTGYITEQIKFDTSGLHTLHIDSFSSNAGYLKVFDSTNTQIYVTPSENATNINVALNTSEITIELYAYTSGYTDWLAINNLSIT